MPNFLIIDFISPSPTYIIVNFNFWNGTFFINIFSFYFTQWSGNTVSHFYFDTSPQGYCVRPPPSCVNIKSVTFLILGLLYRPRYGWPGTVHILRSLRVHILRTWSVIRQKRCFLNMLLLKSSQSVLNSLSTINRLPIPSINPVLSPVTKNHNKFSFH